MVLKLWFGAGPGIAGSGRNGCLLHDSWVDERFGTLDTSPMMRMYRVELRSVLRGLVVEM